MANWKAAIVHDPASLETAVEAIENTVTIQVVVLDPGNYLLIQSA